MRCGSAWPPTGGRTWDAHGNGFTVYFGLLARIAPFGEHEGRLVLRMPFSGLSGREHDAGHARVRRGDAGLGRLRRPQPRVVLAEPPRPGRGAVHRRPARPGGALLDGALARRPDRLRARSSRSRTSAAVRVAERTVRSDRSLVPEFVQSLVPIALVYAVAHYFTLLVIQGQYALPLASDPFGFGWDLFGTRGLRPEHRALRPEHRLVRPGRRARRRPRRGADGRARPRRHDPARTRRAPVPVRDAGA